MGGEVPHGLSSLPAEDMRRTGIIMLSLCMAACSLQEPLLQTGDLVFVSEEARGDAGSMSQAIVSATGSITHVAIVEVDRAGNVWVIDATPRRGVSRHPLASLVNENSGAVFTVKRLRDTTGASLFVENAKAYIGQPYDHAFMPDNGAMYCSELVRESFRRADGSFLFNETPMNFLAPDGSTPQYWEKLFEGLDMEVPQGVPGTNPQDMSLSPLLESVETEL